jgi:hypothetical protein
MSQTKEQRLAGAHQRFITEFNQIQGAVREVRMQCLGARRFYSIPGAQWEGPLGEQFENKPKFEMNKVHLAVIRIINEYRNNRITVDFVPNDGTQDDDLADTCDGLYRADEQDSGGQEAFDNAFEEGVGGGMGAWRVRARYEDDLDDEDDRQRAGFDPIFDADSCVFFNLDAKRQDKADAKRCYVLTSMTPGAFKEEYGHDPASWPKDISMTEFDWSTPDVVFVAEVYEIEEKTEIIHIFRGLALDDDEPNEKKVSDADLREDPDLLKTLEATGFREVRQKRAKRQRVHKYIMSGNRIEEDCGYISGTCIPIVPFYGKRWYVDNIERCMGHVHLAMDAQRLTNMLNSWIAEIASRFDVEKPILTPEQILGHAVMWAEDNIKKYPYLLVNPITDAQGQKISTGPIGYTKAPNVPPAMAALVQIAYQALEDMLGNQKDGEKMMSNIGEKTVEMIQTRLDMQAFIYMDNFAKAVKRSGEIWLSMCKDIIVEECRKMKTVGVDGKVGSVEMLKPMINPETSERYMENDLSRAKLGVHVDVGPTSSSKRGAMVKSLIAIRQMMTDPQDLKVNLGMIMTNLEGEGMSEYRAYYRKILLHMGVLKPSDEEIKEMQAEQQNVQPDPNAVYLGAAAKEAEAKGQLALANAEKAKADTIKTMAEVGTEHQNQAIAAATALQQAMQGQTGLPGAPPG